MDNILGFTVYRLGGLVRPKWQRRFLYVETGVRLLRFHSASDLGLEENDTVLIPVRKLNEKDLTKAIGVLFIREITEIIIISLFDQWPKNAQPPNGYAAIALRAGNGYEFWAAPSDHPLIQLTAYITAGRPIVRTGCAPPPPRWPLRTLRGELPFSDDPFVRIGIKPVDAVNVDAPRKLLTPAANGSVYIAVSPTAEPPLALPPDLRSPEWVVSQETFFSPETNFVTQERDLWDVPEACPPSAVVTERTRRDLRSPEI